MAGRASVSARTSQFAKQARAPQAVPKSATSGYTKKNVPAKTLWHQGFMVRDGAVSFMTQATAERIAGNAARATKQKMTVRRRQDFWCYGPAK